VTPSRHQTPRPALDVRTIRTAGAAIPLAKGTLVQDDTDHDIQRLRSLRATLGEIDSKPRSGGGEGDGAEADCRAQIRTIEEAWPDDRLLDAYRATDRQAGNVATDALAAELAVRDLSPD